MRLETQDWVELGRARGVARGGEGDTGAQDNAEKGDEWCASFGFSPALRANLG